MKRLFIILSFFVSISCYAQEFFPTYGSASNLPKGVLSIKFSNEYYTDESQPRWWQGYTFSYGISSKIEISQVYSFSDHHGYILPKNFITTDPQTGALTTNGYINGQSYSYNFENLAMSIKYRFLSLDETQEHFRMAAFLQLAGGNEPHEVAESDLAGDNSGVSAGIIATYLKHRFAISLTAGGIFPHEYVQADSNIYLHYGNALTYSLSMGYLLFPLHYKNYNQTNVNLYMEFVGESYQAMQSITKEGETVSWYNVPSLNKGHYIEARPAIQFIFLSNTRVDLSMAYLLNGHSYERSYPLYYVKILHNFYL